MTRQIFLLRFSGWPFKDHWGFWIPSTTSEEVGTSIHATGDVRNGFAHEIKRNYDLRLTRRSKTLTLLGQVQDKHVNDTPHGTTQTSDTTPRDDFERTVLSIPAPGPSMNQTATSTQPTQRVSLRDCQWWISQVVAKLVQENILDASAITTLRNTPSN